MSCRWNCPSKRDCYSTEPDLPVPNMMRIECPPGGSCKAEVFLGRRLIGRKRGLPSMAAANTLLPRVFLRPT